MHHDTRRDGALLVSGEDVLVVSDRGTRVIGESLRDRAAAAGADAVLMVMG